MKKTFLSVIFLTMLFSVAAQETAEKSPVFGSGFKPPESASEFLAQGEFGLQFTPGVYLNITERADELPALIFFPLAFSFRWPDTTFLSAQASLHVSNTYFGWSGSRAVPIEIENRTVSVISIAFDLSAVLTFFFTPRSQLQLAAGLGINSRICFLASGVKSDDSGVSGSAGGDVDEISGWFWQKARFLELTLEASYLFAITDRIRTGPDFSVVLPLGAVLADGSLSGTVFYFGIKFTL